MLREGLTGGVAEDGDGRVVAAVRGVPPGGADADGIGGGDAAEDVEGDGRVGEERCAGEDAVLGVDVVEPFGGLVDTFGLAETTGAEGLVAAAEGGLVHPGHALILCRRRRSQRSSPQMVMASAAMARSTGCGSMASSR